MVKLEDECIYNIIPPEPKAKLAQNYKSKYNPNIYPTASTIGLHGSSMRIANAYGNFEKPRFTVDNIGQRKSMGPPPNYYDQSPDHFLRKGQKLKQNYNNLQILDSPSRSLVKLKRKAKLPSQANLKTNYKDRMKNLCDNRDIRKMTSDKQKSDILERKSSAAFSQSLLEDESVKNALEYEKSVHVNESLASTPRQTKKKRNEVHESSDQLFEKDGDINQLDQYDDRNPRQKSLNDRDFYMSQDNLHNIEQQNDMHKLASYHSTSQLPSLKQKSQSISTSKKSISQSLANTLKRKKIELLKTENIFGQVTPESSVPSKPQNTDFVELERDEASNLVADLRIKYSMLNADYTSMTHKRVFSTYMLREKEKQEDQMKFIEQSITKLSSPKVIIKQPSNSNAQKPIQKFSMRGKYSGFAD